MSRPSDDMTLEELREEYDWIYEFNSRMAERISGNPDVHNHEDYVNRLESENAELRKLLTDFRDAMWDGGEWTEPFDERMRELGVDV